MDSIHKLSLLIVHADRFFDKYRSARSGIKRTIDQCRSASVLEIKMRNSYLNEKFECISSKDGVILDRGLFEKHESFFKADTFILVGGRLGRCLDNAFVSTLLYKLYEPDSIFDGKNDLSLLSVPEKRSDLLRKLSPRTEETSLNFHFNFEGIYPLEEDFRGLGEDPYLSRNISQLMMDAAIKQHSSILHESGWDIRGFAKEYNYETILSKNTRGSKRIINLFYWIKTDAMVKYLKGQGLL